MLTKAAVDAAFEPTEAMTAAFVVTWKGRLIAERYGDGINIGTPLEGWSMGKSITLFGILLNRGAYKLAQPAPIPEWQTPGDPRAKIRIEDMLHMSSGLRIRAPQDPDYDPSGPYPDHLYLYTGGADSYHYAATRPQQWPLLFRQSHQPSQLRVIDRCAKHTGELLGSAEAGIGPTAL
jgi:CubicO group peptidase (beta-lactamase class C family)